MFCFDRFRLLALPLLVMARLLRKKVVDESEALMAKLIPPQEWMSVEEMERRCVYWQYLVETWLWKAPMAVMPQGMNPVDKTREVPSMEALQDGSWVMVPESQASH